MLSQQENILYINQFGFRTTTKQVEIHFHPLLNKFELYSFDIYSEECVTEEITEEISEIIDQIRITSISEFNEHLFFKSNATLLGSKIDCKGTLGPNNEPWINAQNPWHFKAENFTIEIQDLTVDKIKLEIKGLVDSNKIKFIGWLPLELINPNTWVDNFFKKLKKLKEFKTYFHYFNKYKINQSPEWQSQSGEYEKRIISISENYGFTAMINRDPKSGQKQWIIKNNNL